MADHPLPRMTVAEILEDLRDDAVDLAEELIGIAAEDTIPGQAAQLIEEMGEALTQIAAGVSDPKAVAQAVLDVQAPLRPSDAPMDTLRGLLKPRST